MTDGMTVKLYIETGFYFAVQGTNSTGGGAIDATTTAVAAHFLTTTLAGVAGDRVGTDVDGSGDFGKAVGSSFSNDGLSDLLVGGQGSNKHAFLFLASSSGYAATPSVTFTGSAAQFGSAIANAGDIDGDGLDDIAIASRIDGSGKIYIYSRKNPPASWGTTSSWPVTLTDAQATYVVTATTPLTAGSMDVRNLARLGNFDGVGTDDLAVSFDGANGFAGAVFIVKGNSSFASLSIPNASGAIEIDGAAGSAFGSTTLGMGPFFQLTGGGPGLMASAILSSTVYAFAGQSPTGALNASAANDSAVVMASSDHYGNALGFLGGIGSSPAAITVAAPGGQYVDVYFGTSATGPIVGPTGGAPQPSIHLINTASGNSFGVVDVGGGIRGTGQAVSLIGGDSIPDLIVGGQAEIGLPLYIVDGAGMLVLSGTVDVSKADSPTVIKISNQLPTDWAGYSIGSIIPDSNGDGYPDFAVGENVAAAGSGRVIVFY